MTADLWRTALALGIGLAGSPARAGDAAPKPKPADPPVKLGNLPELRLAPRPPVSAAQTRRIKALIACLASLERPDFGLSATLSGAKFAPVPGQGRAGTLLLTEPGIRPANRAERTRRSRPRSP